MNLNVNSGVRFGASYSFVGKANSVAKEAGEGLSRVGGDDIKYAISCSKKGVSRVDVSKGGKTLTGLSIHGAKAEKAGVVAHMVEKHVGDYGIKLVKVFA